MENRYRNRKYISSMVLASIIFILLLSFNFKLYNEPCNPGDFKEIWVDQTKVLNHCILTNSYSGENITESSSINQLLEGVFIGITADLFLLSFKHSIFYKGKMLSREKCTLVSLCVRMDE